MLDTIAVHMSAVDVHADDGTRILDNVSLSHTVGKTLAVLGPSGCGKTTLLRTIAGLWKVSAGVIALRGKVVSSRVLSSNDVHVPTSKRRVGMVFQERGLFPHLTVADNVAFGLSRSLPRSLPHSSSHSLTRSERSRLVDDLLAMFKIADIAHRYPESLSGGQCQRVALARSLAPQPDVLLLDEPFASLDTALRVQLRSDISVLLKKLDITCILVTHDQSEAFLLGDQVAIMDAGRIVQHDTPIMLYEHPVNLQVARFVGDTNIVPGIASGDVATTVLGQIPISKRPSGRPSDEKRAMVGKVLVMIMPEHLILTETSNLNITSKPDMMDTSAATSKPDMTDTMDTSAATSNSSVNMPGNSRVDTFAKVSAIVDRYEYYGHETLYHVRIHPRIHQNSRTRSDSRTLSKGLKLRCRVGGAPRFQIGTAVDVYHNKVAATTFSCDNN